MHWIDNADSYICPVCGFETNNPNKYEECKCPVCGFQDEKDRGRVMSASDEIIYPKRWIDIFHYGFGYTKCPYCGDETGWYNPASNRFQSDLKNNQREYCPKCGKRVFARAGWLMNQPPIEESE